MAAINKDVFFTGTTIVTYTMFMVAILILIDFGAIVISPDDFAHPGYQPVSSRTYFISRLTNVLIYSTLLSLALGIVPILRVLLYPGFQAAAWICSAVGYPVRRFSHRPLPHFHLRRNSESDSSQQAEARCRLHPACDVISRLRRLYDPARMMDARSMGTVILTKKAWLLLFSAHLVCKLSGPCKRVLAHDRNISRLVFRSLF